MIRSYFQMKDVTDNGGKCLFVTFTYNNDNLPYFYLDGQKIAAFDKSHVQKFLDLFRKRLERKFNVRKTAVKYAWFSEYGGKTHRPHYHALFYIYDKVHLSVLQRLITELWKYGFVYFGKNGGLVNNVNACKYVTKYVIKDLDFYGSMSSDALHRLSQHKLSFSILKTKHFPFHLQSTNFGTCISRYISVDDIVNSVIPIPSKNGYTIYHTPQYIDRKLFYYVDDKLSYRLTEKGVDMKIHRHNYVRENTIRSINDLITNLPILVNDDTLPHINEKLFRLNRNAVYTSSDVTNIIRNFFTCHSVSSYVDYVFDKCDVMRLDCDEVTRKYHPIKFLPLRERLLNNRSANTSYFSDLASDKDKLRKASYYIFNKIFLYKDYELISNYIDAVRYGVGVLRNAHFEQNRISLSKYKQVKNHYLYGSY